MPRLARHALVLAAIALVCLLGGSASAAPTYRYPKAVSNAFVRGCVKGGSSKAICNCIIVKLQQRDSYKKFKRLVVRFGKTGKLPPELRSVAVKCAAKR
ncbi:MAG: hypothetical protein NVSMB25_00520 [Thermoleophilaceae bacterium]